MMIQSCLAGHAIFWGQHAILGGQGVGAYQVLARVIPCEAGAARVLKRLQLHGQSHLAQVPHLHTRRDTS